VTRAYPRRVIGNHTPLIAVEAAHGELHEESPGVIDVFAALDRQFFWADRVMLALDDDGAVVAGEIVSA